MLCNGALVSRTTYAALFAVIGTVYGEGDGSTTFALPDLRGRYIEGQLASPIGTYWDAGLPEIWGQIKAIFLGTSNVPQSAGMLVETHLTSEWMGTKDGFGYAINDLQIKASLTSSIYGASPTVQPPAVTMRYFIKY